jgi:hypothetical protein
MPQPGIPSLGTSGAGARLFAPGIDSARRLQITGLSQQKILPWSLRCGRVARRSGTAACPSGLGTHAGSLRPACTGTGISGLIAGVHDVLQQGPVGIAEICAVASPGAPMSHDWPSLHGDSVGGQMPGERGYSAGPYEAQVAAAWRDGRGSDQGAHVEARAVHVELLITEPECDPDGWCSATERDVGLAGGPRAELAGLEYRKQGGGVSEWQALAPVEPEQAGVPVPVRFAFRTRRGDAATAWARPPRYGPAGRGRGSRSRPS